MERFAEVERVAALLRELRCEWYVCGGWALDLRLGRVTRAHKDVDVSVARRDQLEVRGYLKSRGWRLEKAHGGELSAWRGGEFLSAPLHTVWCRNGAHEPGFLELQLDDIDDEGLAFRRDPTLRIGRARMSFVTPSGVPVLAPEVVLLYKSNAADEYAEDFGNARGALDAEARAWLREALMKVNARHPWIEEL